MLSRVVSKAYGVLDFDHITAEMHGDVAITLGRYLARSNGVSPERALENATRLVTTMGEAR